MKLEFEIDYKHSLAKTRRNFACSNIKERLPKPVWLTSEDTLYETYNEYHQLFEIGEIHYACLVQANTILFRSFPPFNCPANILVSASEYYDCYPFELEQIASNLFSYKNSNNAPDNLKKIAHSITDEYERLYNVELEHSLTNNETVFFTSIMVFRKHLPGRKLQGSIFPVITNPNKLQSTIILPKTYWTNEFINLYKS